MSTRGFSLVELMTILAVFAIMMLAAAPSISDWLVNLRIRNAAMALQTGVQTARAEAVRRNENVSFWLVSSSSATVLDGSCALSSSSGSWVVSIDDPTGACGAAPSATAAPRLVASHAVGDGGDANGSMAFASSDGATSITFNGFGRIASGTTPITQIDVSMAANADSYRSLRLLVSGSGAVRLCDPAVGDSSDPRHC